MRTAKTYQNIIASSEPELMRNIPRDIHANFVRQGIKDSDITYLESLSTDVSGLKQVADYVAYIAAVRQFGMRPIADKHAPDGMVLAWPDKDKTQVRVTRTRYASIDAAVADVKDDPALKKLVMTNKSYGWLVTRVYDKM